MTVTNNEQEADPNSAAPNKAEYKENDDDAANANETEDSCEESEKAQARDDK